MVLTLEGDPVLLTLNPVLSLLELSLLNHLNQVIALQNYHFASCQDAQTPLTSIKSAYHYALDLIPLKCRHFKLRAKGA